MSKKSEEHYKNHPSDVPHTAREKHLMAKHNKLKNSFKVRCIEYAINIGLLKQQLKSDTNIKNTFRDMFPVAYEKTLEATKKKYGLTQRREVRREELIQSMKLKDRNILK